jgi:hypothetical protein
MGVPLNRTGAGMHVERAENKIRTIKEVMRSILHSLPYVLPDKLVQYLIAYSVFVINLVPNKTGYADMAPREAFIGRKTSAKRDLRIGFGDYCQVVQPKISNTMEARTTGAIALQPIGNNQGSVAFYNIASDCIIVRDHFTVLPCPAEVIDTMNQRASVDCDVFLNDLDTAVDTSDIVADHTVSAGVLPSTQNIVYTDPGSLPSESVSEVVPEPTRDDNIAVPTVSDGPNTRSRTSAAGVTDGFFQRMLATYSLKEGERVDGKRELLTRNFHHYAQRELLRG